MLSAWNVTLRADGPESETDVLIVDESAPRDTLLAYPNNRALWASADRQLAPTDSFVDVLLKPIGPVQLADAITQLLKGERTGVDRSSGAARLRVDVDPLSPAPSNVTQSPMDHGAIDAVLSGVEQNSTATEAPVAASAVSKPRILHVEDNGKSMW